MAKARKQKPKTSKVQITKGTPKTRHTKRKVAQAFFDAAKLERTRKGNGDTKQDRAQSKRAAAFAVAKARGKRTTPVAEDDLNDAGISVSDDDDDTDVSEGDAKTQQEEQEATMAMAMPYTPTKLELDAPLYETPAEEVVNVHMVLEVCYQAFESKSESGKMRKATVLKCDGARNETALAHVGDATIFESTGVVWNRIPSWPDPESPLRGMIFKRLKGEDTSVPLSLYMGLRELNEMYGSHITRVVAKIQVHVTPWCLLTCFVLQAFFVAKGAPQAFSVVAFSVGRVHENQRTLGRLCMKISARSVVTVMHCVSSVCPPPAPS